MHQQLPFPHLSNPVEGPKSAQRRGAFTDNMKLPVHRWFRYSAGFSAEWAEKVIAERAPRTVLDPFAGSGTTLLAAQTTGLETYGFEPHAFVVRVAQAKLEWATDAHAFLATAMSVLERAQGRKIEAELPNSGLLPKCFTTDSLQRLFALRDAHLSHDYHKDSEYQLVWLAITSILRETSHVGTAQWQYVLPNKTKARVSDPFAAFIAKVRQMSADMVQLSAHPAGSAVVYPHDARKRCPSLAQGSVDLVVTSPPYPNNYDYADATRLEMSFWGDVSSWSDLHTKVRRHLITSCSQHSAADRANLDDILSDPVVAPILPELSEVCRQLAIVREERGGRKTYHTMIAAYFRDLAHVWLTLRYHVREGGACYFVVGDSAPYGVYAPVDKWLGELALSAGFSHWSFAKFRDRNIKWKNRKHNVPLKEGVLTVI